MLLGISNRFRHESVGEDQRAKADGLKFAEKIRSTSAGESIEKIIPIKYLKEQKLQNSLSGINLISSSVHPGNVYEMKRIGGALEERKFPFDEKFNYK